ncbi:Thioredoxin-like 3-2, chloroplastic [Trifolium repens]|nr:Thioredoxin-like 3-2, chloroplastic [Trifolium repens]
MIPCDEGPIMIRILVCVLWIANWCIKCIYLKPKLEKLAVDYYPRLQFYSVDVNAVSHKLIARAGVTKMPTIQYNYGKTTRNKLKSLVGINHIS